MPVIAGSWISGPKGLHVPTNKNILKFSTGVDVNWKWYNRRNGIVSWNFVNNSPLQQTVILFRNGYYFGNAYYPIYVQNNITWWATSLSPLEEKGIENNSMPLAIADFGAGNKIVVFIFTLAGGQIWSVLEGGFSDTMPPEGFATFDVTLKRSGIFCIGYDRRQVVDWDRQTGSSLKGYYPNPKTIQTLEMTVPSVAPYVKLFKNDSIADSRCINEENVENNTRIAKDDLEDIIGNIIKRIRSI